MDNDNGRRRVCPVCGYAGLDRLPCDDHGLLFYDGCPCCGTEFGYTDRVATHLQLRRWWIARGMPWSCDAIAPPPAWDPEKQIRDAGLQE